ncbi:MAG: hypothetical protein Q8S21_00035 [Candidatus Paracaedibacteraceae bacterium]|nr:hypothetical protein [Candidatus Paracaedibacteraceae bacterium]
MPINVSLQDQFGNIALTDNDFNFNLDSDSDLTEFSTDGASNWLSSLDLTIPAGTGSLAAYITHPTVQNNVTISVLSDTYGKVDHALNFVPNVYTHIGFVNPKTNLTAGDNTTYTVQLLDDWNNPTTHGSDVVIGLGSNNQALLNELPRALWDTTAASIQDTPTKVNKTITIASGQSSASAVYTDNLATDKTVISAQDNAKWQSYCTSWRTNYYGNSVCENWYHYNDSFIRHNLNISPDTPKLYTFTTDPQVIIKNTVSKPISINVTDQFTNPSYFNNLTSLDLNSVSSTGKFYSDQLGDNEITKLDFMANASNATFYYSDSTVSPITGYDLSLNSSLTGLAQPIRIIEGFATNLEIDTAGVTTVKAGDYLPLTIKAMTSDGREVVVLGDKIISLASSEGTYYRKVGADYIPISQVTIAAESSRTTLGDLYYRSQITGNKTLVASGADLAQTKAYVEVTPDNFTKLAITAYPATIEITKTSSVFNVTSQDLYGNVTVANATANTLINLASTQSSGDFSVDGTNWSANSTLIPLGQSVASFYYKNGVMNASGDELVDASVLGDQDITASSGAASDTVTAKIVGQLATKLNINPTSISLVAGKMSSKVELQLQSSDGSAAITTTDQVIKLRSLNLANDSSFIATYGADEFSSDGVNKISSLTLPAGSSKISFYVTSKTAVAHRIQAYASIHNFSGGYVRTVSAIQTVTVAPDVPSRLFIRSAPQTIHPILNNTADEYSAPIRVAMTDQFGNSTSQGADRNINLASSCGQGIFMNSPTGSVITSAKLLAGQSEVSVYYRDGVAHADACTLTMTSSGLDPDNQDIIVREKVIGLVITTPARTVIAGDTSQPINVSSKDRYGNIVTAEVDTPLVFTAASVKAEVNINGISGGNGQSGDITTLGLVSPQALTSTTTNTIPIGGDTASFNYTYTESVDGVQIDNLTATDQAESLGIATQNITILAGPAAKLKWQTTSLNGQVDSYIPTQVGVLNEFDIPTTVAINTTVNLTNAAGLNPVTGDAAGDFYTREADNSYTKITSTVIAAGDSVSPSIYYRQTTTTNTHAYDGYSPYTPILSYTTYTHPTSVTATSDGLTTATLDAVNISALTLSFSTGNFSAVGRAFTPIKVNINKALPENTTINLSMVTGSGAFYDSNNIPDDSDLINHKVTSVVIPAGQTSSNQVYFRQDAKTATYPWRQPSVLSAEPVSPVYSTWGVRNSATIYYGEVTQIEFVSGPDTLEQNQTGSYIFQTKDSMGNITPFIPYVYGQPNQDTFCVYVKTTSLGGSFSTSRASTEICPSEPGVTGLYLYAGETNIPFNYKDIVVGNPTLNVSTYSSGSGGIEAAKPLNITPGVTTKVVIEPANYGLVRGDTVNNMNVKLMSDYDFNVNSLGDTTINLVTSSATGKFKNPTTGEWQTSLSVVIPTGSKSVNVSYRNDEGTLGSTDDITASASGLTSGTAKVNIVTGDVASVGFASLPQTLERLQTGTVTLKLQDSFGNETVATANTCVYLTTASLTAKLAQTNPVGASECASLELPDGSLVHGLTVLAGTSKISFNYQDSINGVYELKTSLSPSLKVSPNTQNLTIIDGDVASLRFDPIVSSIERGGMASIAVSLVNAYGAEVEALTDQYAKLTSTSASGEFALTELNTWQHELVIKIAAGNSRTELIYRDTIAEIGDYQLTATSTDNLGDPITVNPLNTGTADIHIVNGEVKDIVFITPSHETVASHPSQKITVELQNQYGYSVTATSDQTIYFASSSTSGEFALSQDGPWGITNAKILAGQSSLDLYYRDVAEGIHQITARTSAGNVEVADTQDQTIVRQVMDHFVVDNISTPQKAGTPSSVVVFAVDSEGYVVQWYAGTIKFSADTTDAIYPTDDYTFNPATDKGIHTFTNSVAFKLPGFKDITVTDKDNLTGTQYDIEVLGGNTNPVKSIAIISPTDDPLLLNPSEVSSRITLQLRDANNTPTNATAVEGYPLHLVSSSPTTQFALSPNGPWTSTLDITIEQGLSYTKQPIYCRDSTNGSYVITASDWVGGLDDTAVNNDTLNVVTKDLLLADKLTIKSKDYTGTLITNPYLFSNSSTGTISGLTELESSVTNRQTKAATSANWQVRLNDRLGQLTDSALFTNQTNIKYTSKELTPGHLDSNYILDTRAEADGLSGISLYTIPISPWIASLDNIAYDSIKQNLSFVLNTTKSDQLTDIDKATFYLLSQNASFSLSSLLTSGQAKKTAVGSYQISLPINQPASGSYQLAVSLIESVTGNPVGDTADAILAQDLKNFTVTTPVIVSPNPITETPVTETPVTTTTEATATPTKPYHRPTVTPDKTPDETTPTVLGKLWSTAISSPITPIAASSSFFMVMAIIAIVLVYQAYREWRRSKWLLAMIKKDKALVEDKDAFLQLAAHYLRTPIAIVGSSVDLLTHAFNYDANLANKLIAIATNLREKSEQILARTNESPNVDKITAEDENAFKRRILRSPIFWLPITLSVVLTLLVNWVVTSLGGQDLDTGFIIGQMLSIILAGIVLYTAVREFTMYHEKEVRLEEYRVKARALDNIKNQFIADVYQDLSYDVAELATHDMQTIQNDIVRNSLVDASTRLGKLIERFATLLSVQKGNLELSQFSLDSLINQAIAELSLDMPNQPSVTIPTSLHQDKRMLLKVIETILTTMSGKGSVKDFRFKATTTHNGSLKLEISGHTKYKLLSTSGNLFSASLAATDIQHYNYDEPTPVSTTIDATSSTGTMNNANTINANYTADADNANANNPNENNDDANTANNLDIYLSKLIVNRLGGKLSIKQTGEKAVVGLVVPVSE